MPERLSEACRDDDFASQAVGLAAGKAGANSVEGSSLRGRDGVVHQSLPLIGAGADHDRPGQVGTVSVHLGAEVKQEELSRPGSSARWFGHEAARPAAPMPR